MFGTPVALPAGAEDEGAGMADGVDEPFGVDVRETLVLRLTASARSVLQFWSWPWRPPEDMLATD